MSATPVIFRIYPDGDLIALFPDLAEQPYHPEICRSYMHLGQHGGANYNYVVSITKPATPAQYAPLMAELESVGYDDLKVYRRSTPQITERRYTQAYKI